MIWPFGPREVRVVVEHRIIGLPSIARAIHALAKAKRYEARVRGGFVHAKPKEERRDPEEWAMWDAAHAYLDEAERIELRWAYRVLRQLEVADEAGRERAMILYQAALAAGYELPEIDGRKLTV